MKISKRTVQRARYIRKRYLETFLYLSVSETLPGQKLEYLTCFSMFLPIVKLIYR